jgi:hypothetical protein
MTGPRGCDGAAGIHGAMRRCGEDKRAGRGLGHSRGQGVGHSAVMRSVASAAGRQARVVAGRQDGRERSQPVQQNQRNGEYAPHRRIFIYGNETVRVKRKVVVRSSRDTL